MQVFSNEQPNVYVLGIMPQQSGIPCFIPVILLVSDTAFYAPKVLFMPTTHHCQVCKHVGFCKKHMGRCDDHPKVFYYKQGTTGKVKRCEFCLNGKPAYTLKPRS